ncbi:MAG: YkgJ family cysteine cluster protein [Solirubrobacterales bacterium]
MSEPVRYADIEAEARDRAAAALAQGETAAARAAIAVAESAMAEALGQAEIATAVAGAACAKGCGWCCHQVVGITAAEEMMVVEAVQALPPAARAGIRCRAGAAEDRLARLPVERWQAERLPCPLLDDGACLIHAQRPLPCRAVLSADAGACRRWFEGEDGARIPLVAVQRRVYSSAQAGLAQALAGAGIPPGPVSLVEALVIALA